MNKVAVLGAGSWGTAFSIVLADAGNQVQILGRRDEVCQQINAGENTSYLPGIQLPAAITASTEPTAVLAEANWVVLAVPSQSLRKNLANWAPTLPKSAVLISLMKGVELGTTKRMSEVISEVTGMSSNQIGIVSGPNLAREIANREPAASVVACTDAAVAAQMQKLCHTPAFRPYTSQDVIGCELAGAYKNVVALCVGMAVGLGFGDNTTASVITRGLAETARLGVALGADPITMMGLAGLGDLVATCSSPLSRNRTFGEKLGQGLTVAEVVESTNQVAEGAKSCDSIQALAKKAGVEAPIAEHVAAVVRGEITARDMINAFVSRATKSERD